MGRAGILVIGHTRTQHLKNTLESLARQGAIDRTHVWLDGHGGSLDLIEPVYQCRSIADHFVSKRLVAYNGRVGINKLALDALTALSAQYDRLIILEDDSFPTYSAVRVFEEDLERIEKAPKVFSIYGHHLFVRAEGETQPRFVPWGWATTTAKLQPVLQQARECYSMSEPEFRGWVGQHLTPEVSARLDILETSRTFFAQIPLEEFYFALDECITVITAAQGMSHRKTSRRVVYNCGLGGSSTHYPDEERFRHPPYNMISPSEVWKFWED